MNNSKKDKALRQGDLLLIKLDAALTSFLEKNGVEFSNELKDNTDKTILKGKDSTHEHALVGGKVAGFNEPVSFNFNGKPVEILEIFQGGVIEHRDVHTQKPFRQNHDSLNIDEITTTDLAAPDEQGLWVAYRQVSYQPEGYRRAVD